MGNDANESRDRDQQILNRLARIEHRVDSLDRTQAFSLRADENRHFEVVKQIFQRSERKAQVYLAVDGGRSVGQIAAHLGMKRQNVSRALSSLQEEGLLEIISTNGPENIWGKTSLDRTLRISKFLTSEYNLQNDGTKSPRKGNGKRK